MGARQVLSAAALTPLTLLALLVVARADEPSWAVTGTVTDLTGRPINGATVRAQGTELSTTTTMAGTFALAIGRGTDTMRITASAMGSYIGATTVAVGAQNARIILRPLPLGDNATYEWRSAVADAGPEALGCAACHSAERGSAAGPFDGWAADAHSGSVANRRFQTMYLGTDLEGRQSPLTRYVVDPDYGRIRLAPDQALPYFGPGYRIDFPDSPGSCSSCHAPAAAARAGIDVDPSVLAGVDAEGVTCDVCHKVVGVGLDASTRLPAPSRPGVQSLVFGRPPPGQQVFFGPFDDVAPGDDAYLSLQRESRFCAACHYGTFWGTTVYDSYGQWLRSPYSDPTATTTCQDCHMPPSGTTRFARQDRGALVRDAGSIPGHAMPGAADRNLLRGALDLTVAAVREYGRIAVTVTVANVGAGHDVPTDSPLRQVLLVVDANEVGGQSLAQLAGPLIPDWVGEGAGGHPGAGAPGTAYAFVLQELWTDIAPTGAYWNPTRVLADTRLPALGVDRQRFEFAATDGAAVVEVRLVFRRAFLALARQKGWPIEDIETRRETIHLAAPLGEGQR